MLVKMLLKKQQNLAAYFSKKIQVSPPPDLVPLAETDASPKEDAFIQKVREIVATHYSDEDFALPQLCRKVHMSRYQLYRKMQALIVTSPSHFIRQYRLKKAKQLLASSDLTVSEVSWKVGYKDVAHFHKSYKAAFGIAPGAMGK